MSVVFDGAGLVGGGFAPPAERAAAVSAAGWGAGEGGAAAAFAARSPSALLPFGWGLSSPDAVFDVPVRFDGVNGSAAGIQGGAGGTDLSRVRFGGATEPGFRVGAARQIRHGLPVRAGRSGSRPVIRSPDPWQVRAQQLRPTQGHGQPGSSSHRSRSPPSLPLRRFG